MIKHLRLPRLSWRFIPVWQRNYLVWKKLAIPSILGNLADPMLYMLGLGFGLGSLLPDIERHAVPQFSRRRNRGLQHHERRHLRGAVFEFFAHARAAHLGRHSQRADDARRRDAGRTDLGDVKEPALRRWRSSR